MWKELYRDFVGVYNKLNDQIEQNEKLQKRIKLLKEQNKKISKERDGAKLLLEDIYNN